MEKKGVLVAIFAHPDDEAFGPGGTLATYALTHDVYLICATRGDAGQCATPTEGKQLSEIRSAELIASTSIIGVKKVIFLDYADGTLCNNVYHEVVEKIQKIIEPLQPDILLTYEPHGVSGHIDHVFMSMVTNYIFDYYDKPLKLMMYCLNHAHREEIKNYFVHFPRGYMPHEIDEVIEIENVWDKKLAAMHKHQSQKKDLERVLNRISKLPKNECFLVRKK